MIEEKPLVGRVMVVESSLAEHQHRCEVAAAETKKAVENLSRKIDGLQKWLIGLIILGLANVAYDSTKTLLLERVRTTHEAP